MLRIGGLFLLTAVVGSCLTSAVMLGNFWRRMPRREHVIGELLFFLVGNVLAKDYINLLKTSHIQPTSFDRILYKLNKIFAWVFVASVVLVLIGFIVKTEVNLAP